MPSTAEKLMSLDEFLTWEREQPERCEYARGVITMMTGTSAAHATRDRGLIAQHRARGSRPQKIRLLRDALDYANAIIE
jgi:Uma2 family endonuclease